MNLFSGFFAIVQAAQKDYVSAGWLIVLAGIFDALDGAMARLTNSSSEFGVELDSLADVVSFGTAPSFILYAAFFHEWRTAGVVIASLPALCGALRLARFNVQLVGFDKDYFRGLPIPSAALVLMSYLLFYHLPETGIISADVKPVLLTVITLAVSLLMVSTIRYETLPKPSPRAIRSAPLKFIVIFIGIVASIVTRGKAIFPFMLLYLVLGIVRQCVHMYRHRSGDEEDDTVEGEDVTPFDV
ncbi:MAG: CDP-diacylglycerol--serine O-phosphatidyltransferase [Bacteroidetes bacterium]|nr:CDP-diacylglycerol--serine O-phosphatidyltransferase [Bacteroidota bacterium]